jgi:hypothetical protein
MIERDEPETGEHVGRGAQELVAGTREPWNQQKSRLWAMTHCARTLAWSLVAVDLILVR